MCTILDLVLFTFLEAEHVVYSYISVNITQAMVLWSTQNWQLVAGICS